MSKTKIIVATICSLYGIYYCATSTGWHFIDSVNLIIHESGHVIFMLFGQFLGLLGGSLWQILFPIIFVYYFYHRKEYFSASVVLFWVGQNIINVSVYASDAQAMQLPLLGGDNVTHDWNAILQQTNLLPYTHGIGLGLYVIGTVVMVSAIVFTFSNLHDKENEDLNKI